ncbi:MAG: hypothetical protein EA403_13175 [Spirochaetaceae bacterium]|nr:MAG: hypothetical protein EA403_13175 [Spirochaetaceae bacterium]
MVTLSVGDHPSARRFSRALGLKRLRGAWRFPVFADGSSVADARRLLFVPATAPTAAAWGFVLGRLSETHDLRCCVACALLPAPSEGLALINRVAYADRRYYPDILVNPGIPERGSSSVPSGEFLRTALFFLAPHQVVCLEAPEGMASDTDVDHIVSMTEELELAIPDPRELTAGERHAVTTFADTHNCSRAETDHLLRSVRSCTIRTGRFPTELFPREAIHPGVTRGATLAAVLTALEQE